MSHISEINHRIKIECVLVNNIETLTKATQTFEDVCMLVLPECSPAEGMIHIPIINEIIDTISKNIGKESTLVVVGEIVDLVHAHSCLKSFFHYQHWITIKRTEPLIYNTKLSLPNHHFGAVIYTKYKGQLRHSMTRIQYTYCPACDKTTKDYGGKKNSYHHYGTLMSDVWRDIECTLSGDIDQIIERFADLFSVNTYNKFLVLDSRSMKLPRTLPLVDNSQTSKKNSIIKDKINTLLLGDCLSHLKQLPDNSIDFAFADPPYNLGKKYDNYSDNLAITEYFEWCDLWISEIARVLRPGRTCAILNIPLHSIRHFLHMEKILYFQNWIVWDALSFPVRKIMPSHYTILCFSKGEARELPGLNVNIGNLYQTEYPSIFDPLHPLAEFYCRRPECVEARKIGKINDRSLLTDLWWDIHRLHHNSLRADHPTQVPSQLMYRLISIFTNLGETVLDCFNGAGTSTLAAHQLGRQYIGIEKSVKYYDVAKLRHEEILHNLDPFRKEGKILSEKNNGRRRLGKQKYQVPKKVLQLEVKRVAELLGHLPSREELETHGKYNIEFYDEYFSSWSEVYAAARTTGMTDTRQTFIEIETTSTQLSLFSAEEST